MERDVTNAELVEKLDEFLLERQSDKFNSMNWSLRIFRDQVVDSQIDGNKQDIFDLVEGLKEKYKPSSVNYIAHSIKSFSNWLKNRGYTEQDLIDRFPKKILHIPQKEAVVFSDQEYEAMLDHSKGTDWNHLIKLGWNTGMRIKDCAELLWSSVNLAEKMIVVEPSKTSEFDVTVRIPMTSDLFDTLSYLYNNRSQNKYVLPRLATVSLVGNGNISSHFSYYTKKWGVYEKGKTFHAFRRTAISKWLSHPNADIVTVRHLSGHRSLKSLLRYINPSMDKKRLIMGIE